MCQKPGGNHGICIRSIRSNRKNVNPIQSNLFVSIFFAQKVRCIERHKFIDYISSINNFQYQLNALLIARLTSIRWNWNFLDWTYLHQNGWQIIKKKFIFSRPNAIANTIACRIAVYYVCQYYSAIFPTDTIACAVLSLSRETKQLNCIRKKIGIFSQPFYNDAFVESAP